MLGCLRLVNVSFIFCCQVVIKTVAYLTDYDDKVLGPGTTMVNYGNTSWDNGNLVLREAMILNYGRLDITSPASTAKYSDATYYFDKTSRWVTNLTM